MKVRSLLFSMLCMLVLSISLTSCSDDDDNSLNDDGSKVTLPQTARVYILNEGTSGQNNAGIEFYAPNKDADIISDIFYKQNTARLGDTGQDMIKYQDNIYVSIYGSNYIAKLNAACVEQSRMTFTDDKDLAAGIRYMAAENGYIYASFYGGVIAKINANTLEVEKKITGLGNNLEGVTICNNKLYVANSYKIVDTKYIYLTDVFIIDLDSFSLKETLTVTQNPDQLVEEDDKVFLISMDYSDESHVLQLIDPANNNKVSKLGYATDMAAGDDILYLVDSRTDYFNFPETTTTVNTFSSYNIKTGTMNTNSFLKDAPSELESTSIYMMRVNPNNGDIYIATTFYSTSNGNIYRFKKDGTFIEKFDCGGQNPKAAVFFN
mgnify:FL=1